MGALDTQPAQVDVASTETITYPWDTTNYVTETGDTSISNPVVTLTDITDQPQQNVPLANDPSVSGLRVFQKFVGSELQEGHVYLAVVTFTGDQSGNVMSMFTRVKCPRYP